MLKEYNNVIVNRIYNCLDTAESNDYIDKYSTSVEELMNMSYELLQFNFTDSEINKIPKDTILSTFTN